MSDAPTEEPRAFRLGRDVLTVDSPTDFPTRAAEGPSVMSGFADDRGPARPQLRLFEEAAEPPARRPAWRQRLIDAERGFSHSFRSESTLTAYLVAGGAAMLAAGVLRAGAVEVSLLVVALGQAVFVELGRIAVREMTDPDGKPHRVMATASVLAAASAFTAAALTLGGKLVGAWQ